MDEKEHGGKSKQTILEFMKEQMANRLAVAAYLNNKKIPAKVLYIYFEDGSYDMDKGQCLDATKEEFEK